MRFRVIKQLDWAGNRYQIGSVLDIPENHRRLGGLVRGGFVIYDASLPGPGDKEGITPIRANAPREQIVVGR